MILERLRRRLAHEKVSRRHPTPEQAFYALSEGHCMYAGITKCSSEPLSVGLRDWDDENDVLACKAHIGRLRKLDGRRLDELERYLVTEFAMRNGGHDGGEVVVPQRVEFPEPKIVVWDVLDDGRMRIALEPDE